MSISKLHRWLEPVISSKVPTRPDRFCIFSDQANYIYRGIFGLLSKKCVRILDCHRIIYLMLILWASFFYDGKSCDPGTEII